MWSLVVITALLCIIAILAVREIKRHTQVEDAAEEEPSPWGDKVEWGLALEESRRWAEEVKDELEMREPIGDVDIAHSPIEGSPEKYVYIYLDPELAEPWVGPHIIISRDEEDEDRAHPVLCGYYKGADEPGQYMKLVTRDGMHAWLDLVIMTEDLS